MNKLIIFFSFLLSFNLLAQEKISYDVYEKSKVNQILADFQLEKIIDAREDYKFSNIISGYSVSLTFDKPVIDVFSSFFSNQLENQSDRKLWIRINYLFIEEFSMENLVCAYSSLTFIEKRNDEFLEIFTTMERKYQRFTKKNYQDTYIIAIVNTLNNGIKSYEDRKIANKLTYNKINIEDCSKPKKYKINPDSLKSGIFKTFYDFRDNTPEKNDNIKFSYWFEDKNKQIISASFLNKTIKTPNFWGMCDGIHSYINGCDSTFRQLHLIDDKLVFFDYSILEYDGSGAYYGGGIIGGIVASGVSAAIDKFSANNKKQQVEKNNFEYDINTQLVKVSDLKIEPILEKNPIFLLNINQSNPISIKLTINDLDQFYLSKAECAAYKTELKNDLKVCAQTSNNDKKCITVSNQLNEPLVIVTKTQKGSVETLEVVKNKIDIKTYLDQICYEYKLIKIIKR